MSRENSLLDFVNVKGTLPQARYGPCAHWVQARCDQNTWPYRRVLTSTVSNQVTASDASGRPIGKECLNYASQDYLGLVGDARIRDAAREAVDRYGVHSSGSPALLGRNEPMLALADKLCAVSGRERCLLYPTGWAAGYGVIAGLANRQDVILMDQFAHNCLQQGAQVSRRVVRFRHNDADEIERLLQKTRADSDSRGIFLVLESLYSMDADSPDLARVVALARHYEAIIILDVAHDFGAMGERGLGLLERVAHDVEPDVIMGSFSKTFASNGGFVLCSPPVHNYLCYFSDTHIFSNALSPVQASVVLRAAQIVFSSEGQQLRRRLMDNVVALRKAMTRQGIEVGGGPSPIVPAFVGEEVVARLASAQLTAQGLLANLVEFPAVPRGRARFRFQVMPGHSAETAETAAMALSAAMQTARAQLADMATV